MPERVRVRIDGADLTVEMGSSVLAAIMNLGQAACRTSLTGEPRTALCGMGVCFECRVTIDGRPHQRSCMSVCREGMEIETGG